METLRTLKEEINKVKDYYPIRDNTVYYVQMYIVDNVKYYHIFTNSLAIIYTSARKALIKTTGKQLLKFAA